MKQSERMEELKQSMDEAMQRWHKANNALNSAKEAAEKARRDYADRQTEYSTYLETVLRMQKDY